MCIRDSPIAGGQSCGCSDFCSTNVDCTDPARPTCYQSHCYPATVACGTRSLLAPVPQSPRLTGYNGVMTRIKGTTFVWAVKFLRANREKALVLLEPARHHYLEAR